MSEILTPGLVEAAGAFVRAYCTDARALSTLVDLLRMAKSEGRLDACGALAEKLYAALREVKDAPRG